jgi:hypothetical protein
MYYCERKDPMWKPGIEKPNLKVEKYCFLRLPNARCKTFSFDHYFQITIRLKTNNCFATNMAEGTISMRKWKEKKSLHSEERNEE